MFSESMNKLSSTTLYNNFKETNNVFALPLNPATQQQFPRVKQPAAESFKNLFKRGFPIINYLSFIKKKMKEKSFHRERVKARHNILHATIRHLPKAEPPNHLLHHNQ